MARGKHASSAEARRARETAEAEVARGQRKIDAMTREIAELKDSLERERQGRVTDVRRLNGMVEAATSDELTDLRQRMKSAESDFQSRAAEAMGIARFSLRPERAADLTRMAEALGVQFFSEVAPLAGVDTGEDLGFSRRDRRRAPKILTNGRMTSFLDAEAKGK